jgi:hypothetical protein
LYGGRSFLEALAATFFGSKFARAVIGELNTAMTITVAARRRNAAFAAPIGLEINVDRQTLLKPSIPSLTCAIVIIGVAGGRQVQPECHPSLAR